MAGIHQDVPKCVRAELRYTYQGNNASNVLHVGTDVDPTPADLATIRDTIVAWFASDMDQWISHDVILTELVLTDLSDINGSRLVTGLNAPGTAESESLPANASLAIKADIGTRGKGKNGRVFQFGLPETAVNGSTAGTGFVNGVCAAWNALNSQLGALAGITGLVVPHLVVGGVRVPVAEISEVLNFVCTNPYTDSQKNRLPFHKKKKKQTPVPTP